MSAWLIGHPDYKDMWAAAGIWNAVLDMSYMITSSDIPDWMYACVKNETFDDFSTYTVEDNKAFFNASPISQVANVTTPALFIVGSND